MKSSLLLSLSQKTKTFFTKNEEWFVFWTTLSFYLFLFFFNLNNKTLMLLFIPLIFIYHSYFENIRLSLFLSFLASYIFFVGKSYQINIIPRELILSDKFPEGVNLYFVIGVRDVLSFLMLFFLIKDTLHSKKIIFPLDIFTALLFFYYTWTLVGSLFFSLKPEISLLFLLQSFELMVFFLFYRSYFAKSKKATKLLIFLFSAILVFEGVITGLQFINGSYLGTSIEGHFISSFGRGTDEYKFYYRPQGTFNHPNFLANFTLPLLLITFSYLYHKRNYKREVTAIIITAFLFGGLLLILTASRSAWLSFVVGLLFFLFFVEKLWHYPIKLPRLKLRQFLLLLLPIITAALLVLPWRITKSFYTFEEHGGGHIRQRLLREALILIQKYPLFGVGLDMSVLAAFRENISGLQVFFPNIVHNGFLIIALESGVPALLFFLGFLFFMGRKVVQTLPLSNKHSKIGCIAGISALISLSTNMLLQLPTDFIFLTLLSSIFIFANLNEK